MLVLSRKKDESIIIADNIEVVVIEIRGDKVRLGLTAPKDITINRKEVHEAIQRQKKEKANGPERIQHSEEKTGTVSS